MFIPDDCIGSEEGEGQAVGASQGSWHLGEVVLGLDFSVFRGEGVQLVAHQHLAILLHNVVALVSDSNRGGVDCPFVLHQLVRTAESRVEHVALFGEHHSDHGGDGEVLDLALELQGDHRLEHFVELVSAFAPLCPEAQLALVVLSTGPEGAVRQQHHGGVAPQSHLLSSQSLLLPQFLESQVLLSTVLETHLAVSLAAVVMGPPGEHLARGSDGHAVALACRHLHHLLSDLHLRRSLGVIAHEETMTTHSHLVDVSFLGEHHSVGVITVHLQDLLVLEEGHLLEVSLEFLAGPVAQLEGVSTPGRHEHSLLSHQGRVVPAHGHLLHVLHHLLRSAEHLQQLPLRVSPPPQAGRVLAPRVQAAELPHRLDRSHLLLLYFISYLPSRLQSPPIMSEYIDSLLAHLADAPEDDLLTGIQDLDAQFLEAQQQALLERLPEHLLPVETPSPPPQPLFLSQNAFPQALPDSLLGADSHSREQEFEGRPGYEPTFKLKRKNFQDSQANQRHYFRQKESQPKGAPLISASQSNTQKHYIECHYKEALGAPSHLQVGQPAQKNLFPRGVLQEREPYPVHNQENVKLAMEGLGGLRDTRQDMLQGVDDLPFYQTDQFQVRPDIRGYQSSLPGKREDLVALVQQLDVQEERDPFLYDPARHSRLKHLL